MDIGGFFLKNKGKESWIVKRYLWIFEVLRWISPFHWFNEFYLKSNDKDNKTWIEAYVLANGISAFLLLIFWPFINCHLLKCIIVGWGCFRVFEVLIALINVIFFDWYRKTQKQNEKTYVIRGYLRITLLMLHNFAEIIFWFSILYLHFNIDFIFIQNNFPQLTALAFSFYTMTTFGHWDGVNIASEFGYALTLIQAIIGLFITLLIISKFISLFPRIATSDQVEKEISNEEEEDD